MKIKISKSLWEDIGKKSGWKKAMAVPITEDIARKMARDKIYTLLNLTDVPKPMPKTKKTDIEQILNDNGIVQLFNEMSPVTVLQLPKIFAPNDSNIVEIDGQQYYLAHVTESKTPGKSDPKRGLQKGVHYDGKIICLNMDSGQPIEFSYDEYANRITTPDINRRRSMEEVNEAINKYNQKIVGINKALGVEKLALQFTWIEGQIEERLQTLQGQLNAVQRKQDNPLSTSEGYREWIDFLRDGVSNRRFPLRDTFDTLIFLHKLNPQQLAEGIENNSVEVPQEIRAALLAIAYKEMEMIQEKREDAISKEEERTERMESPLPEDKEPELQQLRPMTLEEMPETKYRKATEYQTLQSWAQSLYSQRTGIERNINELQELKNTFDSARQYLGALEKGTRGVDFLRSPEGRAIVDNLRAFLDRSESFLKKYAIDVIKDGTINPQLMGRSGQLGNALIGVALLRIYTTIKQNLERVESETVPSERQPISRDVPVASPLEPVSEAKDKIKKLSEALWKAFENKMRLR